MLNSTLHHLPLVLAIVALLVVHLFRLDVRISSAAKKGPRTRRPRPVFAHREMSGKLILVDPDGRVSRRGRR